MVPNIEALNISLVSDKEVASKKQPAYSHSILNAGIKDE